MNAEYYVCSLFCLLLSLAQSIETTLDFDATDLFSPYVCLYRSHHITKHTEYTVRSACSHFNFIDLPMIGSGCAGWRMNISNHIYLFVVDHQQSTQKHRNWHFVICFFFSFLHFPFFSWIHLFMNAQRVGALKNRAMQWESCTRTWQSAILSYWKYMCHLGTYDCKSTRYNKYYSLLFYREIFGANIILM